MIENMCKMLRASIIGLSLAAAILMATVIAKADEVIKLGTANTVVLRGEINDETAQTAALQLIDLSNARMGRDYTIYLVLDTPGGSIDAGEALIEVAKTIPNVKTVTVFAASMGSAIVEAMPGERLVLDSGLLMFHRAKGSVSGQFETGELESRLAFYKKYVRRMEQRNADRMGMTLRQYKKAIKDELWLTGSESVKTGAADRIVSLQCTQALIDKNQHVSATVFIFKIELDYSGCPLLRSPTVSPGQSQDVVNAYEKSKTFDEYKKLVK